MNAMDALNFNPNSDIPSHEEMIAGRLQNGLSYAILPHNEPPEHVSIRLIIGAGSLMESESERGLAHFLEHLAFCGSEHFSQGDLIESMQRMGMKFGHHSNAATGFETTVYKLELPNGKSPTLQQGLLIFRDYLDGLNLEDREIDRERGVILSELRDVDSPEYRSAVEQFEFLYPKTSYPKRFPIGVESVIAAVDHEQMRHFYETYYVPDNAALVIIGDVDPQEIVVLLQHIFGDIPQKAFPRQTAMGTFSLAGSRFKLHREEELPQTWIGISVVEPLREFEDNITRRAIELHQEAAHHILTRRLEQLSKTANAPFITGESGSIYLARNGARESYLQLTAEPAGTLQAVKVAEQELRRALQYGFTDAEISRAQKSILKRYENAKNREKTLPSSHIADDWVRGMSANRILSTAHWDYEFAETALQHMTPQSIWESFKSLWAPKNRNIYVSGNLPAKITENAIHEAFRESQRNLLKPPTNEWDQPFSYENFGPEGTVISKEFVEDLGFHRYVLSNGVRLNVKSTDFDRSRVLVRARVGQGLLTEPKNMPGLSKFASWSLIEGGLRKHSLEEIQNLLAGQTWSINFGVGVDAFIFNGTTSSEDFDREMQLFAAYLTDPGYREEGAREALKTIRQVYPQLQHTPNGVLADEGERFLHSQDMRFGYPPQNIMENYAMADVRQWLSDQFDSGYLELTVVGDIRPEEALDGVLKTLGALPKRCGKPAPIHLPMELPIGTTANFHYETQIPKGLVQILWATDDIWNIDQKRKLDLLAEILQDRVRLRIRKQMGETYSPHAANFASSTFKDYGYLSVTSLVDPEKVNDIAYITLEMAQEIRKNGITDDEFLRIKKPHLTQIREILRKNNYWTQSLDGIQAYPQKQKFLESFLPFFENVTRAELDDVLHFLETSGQIIIKIRPEEIGK